MTRRLPLLLALLPILAACSPEEPSPPVVRPVLTVLAEARPLAADGFTGTVEPRYSRDLGFRVLGRIVAREAEIGQSVAAGEVLATLDATALTATLRSREADFATAEAEFGNADATRRRQEALLARRVGSQAELDRADQTRATAAAALTRARAGVDKSREQLSYTRLVSETAGIVTAVEAEVGQTVTAGQTVFTLAQADVLEAVVDLPDEVAGRLARGDGFDVVLQVDPSLRVPGQVREIAPQADAATRTRRVRVTLDAPPAAFRIGTTVSASPRADADPARIDLPESAVLRTAEGTFVWVVDEAASTVARRAVDVAPGIAGLVRVNGGIAAGTRVVTAGVHSLSEGQAVALDAETAP